VAIAALLIYFLTKPAEQVAQQGVTTAQNLMVGGVDVSKQVADSIANLRNTLGGVTDAASAEAALPKLRDITAQIDQVDGLNRTNDTGAEKAACRDRKSADADTQSAV